MTTTDTNAQPRNLNDDEVALIQQTFKGNEALLKSIRALFFGLTTSEEQRTNIKATFNNAQLRAIMWRRFYPTLDPESPIGQIQDVWLGAEQMVFSQSPDTIYQAIMFKKIALDMTKFALGMLENPEVGPLYSLDYQPNFKQLDDRDTHLQVGFLARNQFIKHVEQQLLFLWLIAQQEVKTPAQKKEDIHRSSNK